MSIEPEVPNQNGASHIQAKAEWSEYRPVSAMFLDLEGSVELMEKLGAESYNSALRAFHNLVTLHVRTYNGEVAQYLGDGVMCFFRRARDDMDRAAAAMSAAAEIVEAMGRPTAPFRTNVHVGIASGLALFNDEDAGPGTPVVGACINLAARLQNEATGGAILVCEESKRSAESRFEFTALPARSLKGFAGKTPIWQLHAPRIRASHVQPGFLTARPDSLPLVGRDEELGCIAAAFDDAVAGRGQSVIVAGEAGLGKTRLVQEFLQGRAVEHCAKLLLTCSRDQTSSDYHPIKAYLHWNVGVVPGDDDTRRAAKLRRMFGAVWGLDDHEINDLLILLDSHPHKDAQLSGDPIVLRRWLCGALSRQLDQMRGTRPALIVVVEDGHWLDPSTSEFLTELQASLRDRHILLLCTQRTAGPIEAPSIPADQMLKLKPLSDAQSEHLIRGVLGSASSDAAVMDWVRGKAQGVPLFVSAFADFARRQSPPELGGRGLPLNLLDVFEQSLIRLPRQTRRFVQAAAVMGPVFEPELIATLLGDTSDDLAGHVALLAQEKLVGERLNGTGLAFAHDLVREAIYGNLSKDLRRRLHGDLADLMIREWPDAPSHLLALHYEQGQRPKDAIRHLAASCLAAVRVGALKEATDYLGKAFSLIGQLASDEERLQQELSLRSLEGPLQMIMGGPGSHAFGVAQRRSMELMTQLGITQNRAHVFYNSGLHDWACGRLDDAEAMSETVRSLENEDDGARLGASTLAGLVAWHKGDLDRAAHYLGETVALYRLEDHGPLFPKYMKDFGVFSLFYSGLTATIRGDFAASRDFAARSQALSETLGISHAMGFGLLAQFMTALMRDEADTAMVFARQGEALAHKHHFPEFLAMSRFAQGWSLTRDPDSHAEGLARMIEGVENWRRTEFIAWQSFFESVLIDELIGAGRLSEASDYLASLKPRLARTGENQFLAPALVAEARLLVARGQVQAARQTLEAARLQAERAGAHLWLRKVQKATAAIPT